MNTRAVALALFVFALALAVLSLPLMALTWAKPIPDSWGFRGFEVIFAVTFSGSGWLILQRQPRHVVGWLLLLAGAVSGVQLVSMEYAIASFYGGLDLPAASVMGWLNVWIWVPIVAMVGIGAVLYFPDGRLPSSRWRPAVWLTVLGSAATVIAAVADRTQVTVNMRGIPPPYDPAALGALAAIAPTLFSSVGFGSMSALALAAAVSVVLRFRRAHGAERQQIKWFALAAAAIAVAATANVFAQPLFGLTDVSWEAKLAQYSLIAAMSFVPVSIGIAIRRYRLYDIDLVINRTIVYGATTAVLGATFVAIVLLLQAPLRPLTGGNEIAVAASTMLTLAAFQPLRRRIQDAVDRRFYRSRYDASRTLDSFSSRLRDEVDIDSLRSDLLDVLGDTVRPVHASVWLRRVG